MGSESNAGMGSESKERQELSMRWIIFSVVQVIAIASIAAMLIHGVHPWSAALSLPLIAEFWLLRILFRPTTLLVSGPGVRAVTIEAATGAVVSADDEPHGVLDAEPLVAGAEVPATQIST